MTLRAAMLGLLCCAAAPLRAEEFPYTARVAADGTVFRSGPGEDYYGCGKLDRGTEVEVHRQQAGWLAIRPPAGSFSWVAANDLKLLDGGLAEVTGDGVFAAVGSSLEAARDVQQVRLDGGEVVELLDAEGAQGRAAPKFYRIAPPSGEFRWIAARDVAAHPEGSQWKRASGRVAAPRRRTAAPDETEDEPGESGSAREIAAREDWTAADERRDSAAAERLDADELHADDSADDRGDAAIARPRGESAADDALWDDLDAIDLELSRMVIQEPAAWRLADLRDGAELVLERATGADVRSRARRLVKRIRRFDDIRGRALELADGATPGLERVAVRDAMPLDDRRTQQRASTDSEPLEAEPGEEDVAAAGATAPPADLARKYDGVGTLTRVEAQSVGGPLFALVDEAGAVRKYVSAAPGVNLRPFVGREVGIVGLRGYLPGLKADHVTAKRVEPLGATVR